MQRQRVHILGIRWREQSDSDPGRSNPTARDAGAFYHTRACRPQNQPGIFGEEVNLLSCRDLKEYFSRAARSLITIPTELLRLPLYHSLLRLCQ